MTTWKLLEAVCRTQWGASIDILQYAMKDMSDEEFGKIPTISMSQEQKDFIESHGSCFLPFRGDEEHEKMTKVYSVGGPPFKIHVNNQSSNNKKPTQ
jgi:hypothetical protein